MVRITKVLGLRRPPPYVGKNSQIIPYFFSDAFPKEPIYVQLPPYVLLFEKAVVDAFYREFQIPRKVKLHLQYL